MFYACESLFNKHIFDKRNVRGVKVVSMNGNIAAEVWSMESPDARRAMDADISGAWLARAFPDAQLIRLSLPVAVKSPEMVHDWLDEGPGRWISPQVWEEKSNQNIASNGAIIEDDEVFVPTLALVGIGGVRPKSGHRFIVGLHEPMLGNLQPELGKMIELIEKYSSNGKQGIGCIIGDLCNRCSSRWRPASSFPPTCWPNWKATSRPLTSACFPSRSSSCIWFRKSWSWRAARPK